jgi:hypothetical protein
MKNISVVWAFILILVAGAVKAEAFLLQVPNGLYLPHPYVLSKPISIPPHSLVTVRAGDKFNARKVLRKQRKMEASPLDGAAIFIQSCPVELLKK